MHSCTTLGTLTSQWKVKRQKYCASTLSWLIFVCFLFLSALVKAMVFRIYLQSLTNYLCEEGIFLESSGYSKERLNYRKLLSIVDSVFFFLVFIFIFFILSKNNFCYPSILNEPFLSIDFNLDAFHVIFYIRAIITIYLI